MKIKVNENIIYGISEIVGIYNENGKYEETSTFIGNEKVVFDNNSKNFHVFPKSSEQRKLVSKLISKKRTEILKCFKSKANNERKIGEGRSRSKEFKIEFQENEILLFTTKTTIDQIGDLYGVDIRENENVFNIIEGFGSKGNIVGFNELNNTMYKYITIFYNGAWYTLNFMRMWCDENKTVHCDFNSLQYHRDCSLSGYGLNIGCNGTLDVCYTSSRNAGDIKSNSSKNICFNPYKVSINSSADDIIKDFLDFIKKCSENNECKVELK